MLAQREIGLAAFLVMVIAAASMFVPAFATLRNLRDILANQSILLIGALGMTAVIIAGGIDISVGAILGLAAMAAGKADAAHWSPFAIAAVSISIGLVVGLWNGTLTAFGRVHSIVITLGMLFILRSAMLLSMGNRWLFNLSPRVTMFGQAGVWGMPVLILSAGAAFAIVHVFLRHTVSGRNLYALGGDRRFVRVWASVQYLVVVSSPIA